MTPVVACCCLQVCTIDHAKGGVVRLDATVMYSDECEYNPDAPEGTVRGGMRGHHGSGLWEVY